MLNIYADFFEKDLGIPVVKGRKTDKEKFAGAVATYTMEAMMRDGKSLQAGFRKYHIQKAVCSAKSCRIPLRQSTNRYCRQ